MRHLGLFGSASSSGVLARPLRARKHASCQPLDSWAQSRHPERYLRWTSVVETQLDHRVDDILSPGGEGRRVGFRRDAGDSTRVTVLSRCVLEFCDQQRAISRKKRGNSANLSGHESRSVLRLRWAVAF